MVDDRPGGKQGLTQWHGCLCCGGSRGRHHNEGGKATGREFLHQLLPGTGEPTGQRADFPTQLRGRIAGALALQLAQHKGRAEGGRQLLHFIVNRRVQTVPRRFRPGCAGFGFGAFGITLLAPHGTPALLPTDFHGHAVQPTAEAFQAPQFLGGLNQHEECRLERILGFGWVGQHLLAGGPHHRAVPSHEGIHPGGVAVVDTHIQQGTVRGVACLRAVGQPARLLKQQVHPMPSHAAHSFNTSTFPTRPNCYRDFSELGRVDPDV